MGAVGGLPPDGVSETTIHGAVRRTDRADPLVRWERPVLWTLDDEALMIKAFVDELADCSWTQKPSLWRVTTVTRSMWQRHSPCSANPSGP